MTKLKKTVSELCDQALREIEEITAAEADTMVKAGEGVIIDIRDVRELRAGKIPGSFHCPRGMLEFWADPECEYHKEVFATEKKLILHCALGLRSALGTKTLRDMGFANAVNLKGGFEAWKNANLPTEIPEKKS